MHEKKNANYRARLAACSVFLGGKYGKKNMGTVYKFRRYARDV
jgi:hypothetical protein